jgi:hypothetical protein
MKSVYIGILAVLVSFSAFSQKTKSDTFSDVTTIRLSASSGSAKFIKSSGKEINVTLEYTYSDDEFEYKMEKNGSTLNLEEKFHRNYTRGNSHWSLEIPDGMDVRFNSGSGDLEIDGLEIDIKSNQGSGSILASDTKGEFRLTTGSGDHEVRNHKGDLDLTTGSGDIIISASSGELNFTTGSGDIEVNNMKGNLSATVGSGNIDARGIELLDDGIFTSGSGDVDVRLNAATGASLSIVSGSGDATLDFGGQTINATITMEANERNGRIVAPFKFDTEEVIERSGFSNNTIRKTVKLGSGNADVRISSGSGTAEVRK